jgi:hypothetical protein
MIVRQSRKAKALMQPIYSCFAEHERNAAKKFWFDNITRKALCIGYYTAT